MAQTAQTAQGIVGSWTYMAPEQFKGQAEPASDQYALAIMVYLWLCGDPPFTGNGSIYCECSKMVAGWESAGVWVMGHSAGVGGRKWEAGAEV